MVEDANIPQSIKQMWKKFSNQTNKFMKNKLKKKKTKDVVLWDSSNGGTYIKSKHGNLK